MTEPTDHPTESRLGNLTSTLIVKLDTEQFQQDLQQALSGGALVTVTVAKTSNTNFGNTTEEYRVEVQGLVPQVLHAIDQALEPERARWVREALGLKAGEEPAPPGATAEARRVPGYDAEQECVRLGRSNEKR